MKKADFILISLLAVSGSLSAQEVSDSTEVIFRQSSIKLENNLGNNASNLNRMLQLITQKKDSANTLRAVRIVGAASPEGSISFNRYLSEKRAEAILSFFNDYTELPDSISSFEYKGRDWEGLLRMAEADENMPDAEAVIGLLREIVGADSQATDAQIAKLKRIGGGRPYRYMYRNFFPALRSSRLYVDYVVTPDAAIIPLIPETHPDITLPAPPVAPKLSLSPYPYVCESCKPFYMGLKTNMLYDALALPNIGAEFYLGKNLSIAGNWMYGWWDNNSRHRYWRAYGGDIALRWWFGNAAHEKPLTGHHLGIYGGVVTYDFEFGGQGIMGGRPGGSLWDRCQRTAGIEYGYSLPVSRRLNIDFTIGIGYLGGTYVKYKPGHNCYTWESTHKLTWLGPTKAEVSLVWLIGCGNYNKKGGAK